MDTGGRMSRAKACMQSLTEATDFPQKYHEEWLFGDRLQALVCDNLMPEGQGSGCLGTQEP